MPLATAPITIGERAWIAADVFISGLRYIGDGAVELRARACQTLLTWAVAAAIPPSL